ncbi:MAG: tRNA pseudouridine(55) synthase TruB [Candidatus Cloacimonadota bacterium]|nr:MAG: tRNA pseudouridine(55) synthase TruB [Candidatus Cloacimonadota bacterium]
MNLKNGIIFIDKPAGLTSFQTVHKARKLLDAKKAGHTGTLDPFASGLLIVMFGRATKFIPMINCDDKTYRAVLKLGKKTDTGDCAGKVIEIMEIPDIFPNIKEITSYVLGIKEQIPPRFSALKVNGKRAYDLARQNKDFKLSPRPVSIKNFSINSLSKNIMDYTVTVSKGTYIRTLSESIAEYLGTVGTTEALTRLSAGNYSLENAVKLEDLTKETIKDHVLTPSMVFPEIPEISLNNEESKSFLNGNFIKNIKLSTDRAFVFDEGKNFLGYAIIKNGILCPKNVFN